MSTKPPTATPPTAPITFEAFEAMYRARLGDPDQPSCYVAYVRAEAQVEQEYGARRYKNYATFVATRTRNARREPTAPAATGSKVPVKCHICDNDLYLVPRGDLRTIIPHICDTCRDEIRKIIFTQ